MIDPLYPEHGLTPPDDVQDYDPPEEDYGSWLLEREQE